METSGTMTYGYLKGWLHDLDITEEQQDAIRIVLDMLEDAGVHEISEEEYGNDDR